MSKGRKNIVLENLTVTDYAAKGKSIARLDGKVIFIERNAVPGDVVDVQIFKNKKGWAEGRVINFRSYSKDRVQPFCQHFGICGGCQWQMLPYEKQLQYKQQQVKDDLTRIGKLNLPDMNPIIGAKKTRFYRNKLEFTFSNKAYLTDEEIREKGWEKRNALGFHIPKMFDKILDIEKCHLQEDPSNAIRNEIRRFSEEKGYEFYDLRAHTGWLRNLIIRNSTLGEIMINLCIRYEDPEKREELLRHLQDTFPEITTIVYTINNKQNDSILDLKPRIFSGPGYIQEKLGPYTFKIGPKSFFQTNTLQAEVLYEKVKELADLEGVETVYDLYCGTGSIGIYLSGGAGKIIGVEIIGEAIKHAKENAALNKIENAAFFTGDVITICTDDFFQQNGNPDLIIVDPPRAGMHKKLIDKLLEIAAPKMIYVSCNPATQARDLEIISDGYDIKVVQPLDMFPHTHHIENIVLLEKKPVF